jgi:hypothetical protein
MFVDEGVIFDAVTPEWIAFCHSELKFSIPPDVPTDVALNKSVLSTPNSGPDAVAS